MIVSQHTFTNGSVSRASDKRCDRKLSLAMRDYFYTNKMNDSSIDLVCAFVSPLQTLTPNCVEGV